MQMRGRKYIRFDFTQAAHIGATHAEWRDYRIIARTRTSDHSVTRALTHAICFPGTAHAFEGEGSAQQPKHVRSIRGSPIYYRRLRGSRFFVQRRVAALAERSHARDTTRAATTLTATSVSNRNDAHAHRNRIFLRRHYQIFVAETLQSPISPHESRRQSSDSARVIRLKR
jgi:hypothetical protein